MRVVIRIGRQAVDSTDSGLRLCGGLTRGLGRRLWPRDPPDSKALRSALCSSTATGRLDIDREPDWALSAFGQILVGELADGVPDSSSSEPGGPIGTNLVKERGASDTGADLRPERRPLFVEGLRAARVIVDHALPDRGLDFP